MQGEKIAEISGSVMTFFNRLLKGVSETTRFVQRKSKIDGPLFAQTLITSCLSDPLISLERLCGRMRERGVKVSKQGLQQRFNGEASEMMKRLLSCALKQFKSEQEPVLALLKPFTTTKLTDSSQVMVANCLKKHFKGSGGSASEAALKLQAIFDYVRGQLDEVTVTHGTQSDQGFRGHWKWVEEGALYLQDLGYFKVKFFEMVQEKKAYFISRYFHSTKLWDAHGRPLNLLTILKKAGPVFEEEVRLGAEGKVSVRLIASRLPEEEVKKRRRKLKENARKKGKTLSQELIEFAEWSIYITNVSQEWLRAEQVHLVYSLRWQIELFFKLCKSEAGIDKVSGRKKDRVLCELYAKLICVVLLMYFCIPVRWKEDQELSLRKAYKSMRMRASEFYKALRSRYRMTKFIQSFLGDLKEFALKDKYRKKRLTHQKIIESAANLEVLV
jgi:hypothetical protein